MTKKLLIAFIAIFGLSLAASAQHHKSAGLAPPSPNENSGPMSNATVSFGGWMVNGALCPAAPPPAPQIPTVPCPIVDRFPAAADPLLRFSNHHGMLPQIAKIKAGGTVNFIIGGFHVIAIYDDGTQPGDIDTSLLVPNRPPPGIINDPASRIYRGLDPATLPLGTRLDRVEVVQFDEPGTYLVICAVLPHFNEGMYGYVRVLPRDDVAQAPK